MSSKKNSSAQSRRDEILAETRKNQLRRERGYRERALKIFPWICARCGREFAGKRLRELTVHHRDHDHDNNPPDGSNWELLCLYCHDNEHSRDQVGDWYEGSASDGEDPPEGLDRPFAGLDALLKHTK